MNVAKGKPASQSGTYKTALPGLAVDGDYFASFYKLSIKCTHTQTTTDPWWGVDLEQDTLFVKEVRIWNRVDALGRYFGLFYYLTVGACQYLSRGHWH